MHQLLRRSPQKPQLDLIADRMPLESAQRSLSLTIYLNVTDMQKLSLKGHIATKDALKKEVKIAFG
jgi:hypothetical protein